MNWIQYPDLLFDEEEHRYLWRGQVVTGVTSIFDRIGYRKSSEEHWNPLGIPDFCKSDEASFWGSSFHRIAEIILKGGTVNIADPEKAAEAQPYIDGFNRFLDDYQIQPLYDENGNPLIEYPGYSEIHKIAGMWDFFGLDKNYSFILPDWKTSASFSKTYGPQTAAYEQIIKEVFKDRLLYTAENEPIAIKKNSKVIRMPVLFNPKFKKGYEVHYGESGDWNNFISINNTLKFAA